MSPLRARRRRAFAPPIEVRATAKWPLGMAPARFLRDYWQKRPLLIREAFPRFHGCISADDLAGLACEDAVLARIVSHDVRTDRWAVAHGPFSTDEFARLPKKDWTLLVQDVDKWDAGVVPLLDEFAFLPAWRIDDVMVSYATDGGGVGAHVDQYDVFLIQGSGRRRWRIDAPVTGGAPGRKRAGRDSIAHAFREDTELKLLRQFEPTHDWLLEPGDTLYLPPGVPHEGTAVGECLTFSVGMRAPSLAELMLDFAENVAEPIDETRRYVDPDLAPVRDAHEIDPAALTRARRALAKLQTRDEQAHLRSWFGRFITRYRSAHEAVPRSRPLSSTELASRLKRATVVRNPWSRVAWAHAGRGAELFVAGEAYACPAALARLLCARRTFGPGTIGGSQATLDVLVQLVNAGHFALVPRR